MLFRKCPQFNSILNVLQQHGRCNPNRLTMNYTRACFCLLLGVSSGCVRPITGQVISVDWPAIGLLRARDRKRAQAGGGGGGGGGVNTLRPRQNGRHFADDIFKCIFLNENVWIPTQISLKFVPQGPINNIPALVQIMAWRRLGDKPLSGPMMVRLPTHICVTGSQWVNIIPLINFFVMCISVKTC